MGLFGHDSVLQFPRCGVNDGHPMMIHNGGRVVQYGRSTDIWVEINGYPTRLSDDICPRLRMASLMLS